MELILKYFPNLTDTQRTQFAALKALYEDWNSKIMLSRARIWTTSTSIMCSTRLP